MDYDALEKEARRDAKAFRENAVYDSEGDPVRLTVTADRIDRYADAIATLRARNEALVKANGILEDALQEVGDDYPGSSCQEWCQQRVKAARAALAANREG